MSHIQRNLPILSDIKSKIYAPDHEKRTGAVLRPENEKSAPHITKGGFSCSVEGSTDDLFYIFVKTPSENAQRMITGISRAVHDLNLAGSALRGHLTDAAFLDGIEQLGTDGHAYVVLFLLEAVAAGNTAAARIGIDRMHARQLRECPVRGSLCPRHADGRNRGR